MSTCDATVRTVSGHMYLICDPYLSNNWELGGAGSSSTRARSAGKGRSCYRILSMKTGLHHRIAFVKCAGNDGRYRLLDGSYRTT